MFSNYFIDISSAVREAAEFVPCSFTGYNYEYEYDRTLSQRVREALFEKPEEPAKDKHSSLF